MLASRAKAPASEGLRDRAGQEPARQDGLPPAGPSPRLTAPPGPEDVGASFEVLPEADVRVCPVPGEVLRRHSKGIALKLEAVLATGEGVAGDRIAFRDRLAGDGEAAA